MGTYGTQDFRFSKWFMVDVKLAVRYFRRVEVDSVSGVLDVHVISICRFGVSRANKYCYRGWWPNITTRMGGPLVRTESVGQWIGSVTRRLL
jgi:hypothetical protein